MSSDIAAKLFDSVGMDNHLKLENCIRNDENVNSRDSSGRTPLYDAIVNCNMLRNLNTLLEKGADVFQVSDEDKTSLHIATSKGYKDIIEVLLQYVSRDNLGKFINAKTAVGGVTSLHIAARNGFGDIVKLLMKYCATYNIKNEEGKTPAELSTNQKVTDLLNLSDTLFEAARSGNLEIIGKLQELACDELAAITNARNDQDKSIIQVAIINKHQDFANKLIDIQINGDQSPSCSVSKSRLDELKRLKYFAEVHIESSKFLYLEALKSIVNPFTASPTDRWLAIRHGSYYLRNAHNLLKVYKESTPGLVDNEDIQTVHDTLIALQFDPGHISAGLTDEAYGGKVPVFLSKGQDAKYYNLLRSESRKDVWSFINMIEYNIDAPVKRIVRSLKKKFWSSLAEKLWEAMENGNIFEVTDCIREGIHINSRNYNGETPLHYAVKNDNIDIVNMLLKNGADVMLGTSKGETPLHIAVSIDRKDIIEVLLQHVSQIKLSDFINATMTVGGTTSLHIAAENGSLEIVMFLLEHGAMYNIKNDDGKTPLDLSKNQNVINLLNLIAEYFEDAEHGNLEVIDKIKETKCNELTSITNTCNNQGKSLIQVAEPNKHQGFSYRLLDILKERGQIQSLSSRKCKKIRLGRLKSLKYAAELHTKGSKFYLQKLRVISEPCESERNCIGWITLKDGSYYLLNAYNLVLKYRECTPGPIDDKDIQAVHDMLVALEFHAEDISAGYTDEAYDGKVHCFVSKGQGTKYYNLLHSESREDVRLFLVMVERNIDASVDRFLKSIRKERKK